jgi:membrane protein implicated in regulation of membrane protease activity
MHHLSLILLLIAAILFLVLPWWVALPACLPLLGLLLFTYSKGRQALRWRPATGEEGMIGDRAVVTSAQKDHLEVRYHGEIWRAVSSQPLHAGQTVLIEDIDGLTLRVALLPSPTNSNLSSI